MHETRSIVVLGASISGLSVAHYLAKHTLPQLVGCKDARYDVHIVDQSTHFWWHIAAPRAIVSVKEMKHADCFVPIADQFKQYTALRDYIHFHHGQVTAVDPPTKTISIKAADGEQRLQYFALIVATGNLSPTPLTTLHGDHTLTQRALEDMNVKLAQAKTIVIGGGGPIAVETAGELSTHLTNVQITLITGSDRILKALSQTRAGKAAKLLAKNGVTVRCGIKVVSTQTSSKGVEVKLDNGETMLADVYIPCVGVKPSTDFLPGDLKKAGGQLKTNAKTLRVDAAGPLVYAVGDVASVDTGGIMNMLRALPIAHANIHHDLLKSAGAGVLPAEKEYLRQDSETQVVPVGRKTGVGAFNGWGIPGFVVAFAKGRDYMLGQMPPLTTGMKW